MDVNESPSAGLEIVRGKSFDPGGGGTCAGGAGRELVPGDHVIGTAGMKGYPGWLGAGVVLVFVVLEPHPEVMPTAASTVRSRAMEKPLKWTRRLKIVVHES